MKIIKKILNSYKKYRNNIRRKYLSKMSTQDVFTSYFNDNKWGDQSSRSGKGSNLSSTEDVIKLLPIIFKEYNIKSMVDLPCGDFYWMKHVDLNGIIYTGADIVPEIIDLNKSKFESVGINFLMLDITKDKMPDCDLIFSRDCLVHLSNELVHSALENIKKSNVKYFLTTHYPDIETNEDIVTGEWRAINICKAPFFFGNPISIYKETYRNEKGQQLNKSLALFKI